MLLASKSGVGNFFTKWATSSPNKVSAGRHHSSGSKKDNLCQKSKPFSAELMAKTKKVKEKGLRREMRINSAVCWCISITKKKVAGRVKCLGWPDPSRRLPTLILSECGLVESLNAINAANLCKTKNV